MPELPEVETICRGFAPQLVDRSFLEVTVGEKPLLRQSSTEKDLKERVEGKRLSRLERHGKYLLFCLEGGATLRIHLGMTGRLCLESRPLTNDSYIRLTFLLDDKEKPYLLFHDVRRLGQVRVFQPGDDPLENIGPEPFSQEVTNNWLANQAEGSSRQLKSFLLDGSIISGIGNIYVCEILFAAGLHPASQVGFLSLPQWSRVLNETCRILNDAIDKGGVDLGDGVFEYPEFNSGGFTTELKVYRRKRCCTCDTPIEQLKIAQRNTFFCPTCQRLP